MKRQQLVENILSNDRITVIVIGGVMIIAIGLAFFAGWLVNQWMHIHK